MREALVSSRFRLTFGFRFRRERRVNAKSGRRKNLLENIQSAPLRCVFAARFRCVKPRENVDFANADSANAYVSTFLF